jgi:hypothetical protein
VNFHSASQIGGATLAAKNCRQQTLDSIERSRIGKARL